MLRFCSSRSGEHYAALRVVEPPDSDQKVRVRFPAGLGATSVEFSGVNFQCWLLFWYPFHPRVTASSKRSRSSHSAEVEHSLTCLCASLFNKGTAACNSALPVTMIHCRAANPETGAIKLVRTCANQSFRLHIC